MRKDVQNKKLGLKITQILLKHYRGKVNQAIMVSAARNKVQGLDILKELMRRG